jgi:plasmid maintenance system antidote protein VapI
MNQSEAAEILRNIRDTAFDSSDEKLALALGRPTEEIAEWTRGGRSIDADVVMKARALAQERGANIE